MWGGAQHPAQTHSRWERTPPPHTSPPRRFRRLEPLAFGTRPPSQNPKHATASDDALGPHICLLTNLLTNCLLIHEKTDNITYSAVMTARIPVERCQ